MPGKLFAAAVFFLICLSGFAAGAAGGGDASSIIQDAWTAYNIGEYKRAVRLVEPLAGEGDPRAQVILGRCYENGLGVGRDEAVAAQWFQLAAEQNDSEAQVLLAYCYEIGSGVPKNPRFVVDLMTRAAQNGNAEAQFNLAMFFSRGQFGLPKNEQESFRWARLSAEQGYGQAERFLGACYEYGFGVQANRAEAEIWYQKAARQGFDRQGSIFVTVKEYTMPPQQ